MLEQKVATLEGGYGAICVGTGMAATASCINAFVATGEHVVMTNCSYGGTNRIMREQFAPLGIECDFVDFSDMAAVEAAVKPNTKLIFSESPTNPTLQVPDSSLLHPAEPSSTGLLCFLWQTVSIQLNGLITDSASATRIVVFICSPSL